MRRGRIAGLVLFAAFGGCAPRDATYPVTGVVMYENRPLAGGMVVFSPDPDRGNNGPIALATIKPDGSFELKSEDKTGAIRGWHRVTIAPPAMTGLIYARFPDRFRSPADSGLAWEVKEKEENHLLIQLRP